MRWQIICRGSGSVQPPGCPGLPIAATLWAVGYAHLTHVADLAVASLGLTRDTHLGEALHFFLYDTPKVLLLLVGIVFVMGVVQTFFAPDHTRAPLSGRRLGVGNAMAASLGIVTPFCFAVIGRCQTLTRVPADWPRARTVHAVSLVPKGA